MKISQLVSAVVAHFAGHAAWILAVANFAWMLFRGEQLFTWWIPVASIAITFTAIGYVIYSALHD